MRLNHPKKPSALTILTLLGALVGLLGASYPTQARTISKTIPFVPGERLTFMVSALGMHVGDAELSVGQPRKHKGRKVLPVRGRASTTGLYRKAYTLNDEIESLLDLRDMVPLRFEKRLQEKNLNIRSVGEFSFKMMNEEGKRNKRPFLRKLVVPPFTQDLISAVYFARAQAPVQGNRFTFPMVHGRRVWTVSMKVTGETTLETPLGPKRALVVEGEGTMKEKTLTKAQKKKRAELLKKIAKFTPKERVAALQKARIRPTKIVRPMKIWVSLDTKLIPLRFETEVSTVGKIVGEITSYSVTKPEK